MKTLNAFLFGILATLIVVFACKTMDSKTSLQSESSSREFAFIPTALAQEALLNGNYVTKCTHSTTAANISREVEERLAKCVPGSISVGQYFVCCSIRAQ